MDKVTEEALKRIKISGDRDGKQHTGLPLEEMKMLEKSVHDALKANASFMAQMLLLGLMFSQLLAPHVERHISKQNEGSTGGGTLNLTELTKNDK